MDCSTGHRDLHASPTRRASDLSVTEDVAVVAGNLTTSGALTITDVDQGQSHFTADAPTPGRHAIRRWSYDGGGDWIYSTDDGHTAIQHPRHGQSLNRRFIPVAQ